MKKIKVKLYFPREALSRPLISELIAEHGIVFNILNANIGYDSEGTLIAEISGEKDAINDALQHIKSVNVKYKLYKKSIIVNDAECIDCGACTGVCPTRALQMDENNKLAFDKDECLVCELCIKACPMGAISSEF